MGFLSKYVRIDTKGRGHLHQGCICAKILLKMRLVSEIRENIVTSAKPAAAVLNVITALSTAIRICNSQPAISVNVTISGYNLKNRKLLSWFCFVVF